MWNKFTNAFRGHGGATPSEDRPAGILTGVREQHPDISVFQEPQEAPGPSSPTSPSQASRKHPFQRLSRANFNEHVDTFSKNSKSKVKSSLQSLGVGSESSLVRVSTDGAMRQSQDSARPSVENARHPSTPTDTKAPMEPKFGSLRSILKLNNTPGTGQSVRFFSRDAYRVISPEHSSTSEFDDTSIVGRIKPSIPPRPSAQQLFSPLQQALPDDSHSPGVASIIQPLPPPEIGNIFDLSTEELPTIPTGQVASLLDSAVEISEADEHSTTLATIDGKSCIEDNVEAQPSAPSSPTIKFSQAPHVRSQSLNFTQTLLQSIANSPPEQHTSPQPGRHRALSDSVFTPLLQSPVTMLSVLKRPEADINDTSRAVVAYQSPERDPFAVNATTYYTPGTVLPPSPPQHTHRRAVSEDESMIWSLRTELALKSEVCAQYEVDLVARDETIDLLQTQLTESERECERRKIMARSFRKRVMELEKCVRALEEENERSREESAERSIMDEASGEALIMLHQRISELEQGRAEGDSREAELRAALDAKIAAQDQSRAAHAQRDEANSEPRLASNGAPEQTESLPSPGSWEQERGELQAANDALHDDKAQLQTQLQSLHKEITRKDNELAVLKDELDAQWQHAERHSEDMDKLKREKEVLVREAEALRAKLAGAETKWDEKEVKKADIEAELAEVWALKDELERERDELEQQLQAEQEHAGELTRELQDREDRLSSLQREHGFALDSVKRLQENIRQRDTEIAEHIRRIRKTEEEVEEAQERLTKQKREHNRTVDEQSRRISEVVGREVEARVHVEQLIKQRAAADVELATLKERADSLTQELERLRRQVHELKQESADKEVKIVQVTKQATAYKENMDQLNIALDSKQQEVELLKRGGSAAKAPAGTNTARSTLRRESSIFATPSVSRPSSVLSEAGTTIKDRKSSDNSVVTRNSLARGVRPNSSVLNAVRRIDTNVRPTSVVKARESPISASAALPPRSPPTRSPPSRSPPASASSRSPSVTPVVKPRRPTSSFDSFRGKPLLATRDSAPNMSVASDQDKENIEATPVASRQPARRLSVALPA